MPTLAYEADITDLLPGAQCPPADAVDVARECYRFVHDPLNAESFIPVGKLNPRRMNNAADKVICSMLALSMFLTADQARRRYSFIIKNSPMAKKALGTHLAKGEIILGDGRSTSVDNSGHFDFHPHATIDLPSRFKTIEVL